MSTEATHPFANRVSESRVAAILSMIASPPGKRDKHSPGDAEGDFDFWFDGGACQYHTGTAHYHFTDGAVAIVAAPATWLWVRIAFADGSRVNVCEERLREDSTLIC